MTGDNATAAATGIYHKGTKEHEGIYMLTALNDGYRGLRPDGRGYGRGCGRDPDW